MTRRALAAVLILALAAFGCTKPPENVKQDLQARYGVMDQAVAKEDVNALMDVLDESYVLTQKDGKTMSRTVMQVKMGDAFKEMSDAVSSTKVDEVSGSGDKVVAIATTHQEAIYTDPRGKSARLTLDSRTRDTWEKKNGTWKLTASTEEVNDMVLGTPIPAASESSAASGSPAAQASASPAASGTASPAVASPANDGKAPASASPTGEGPVPAAK